MESVNTLENETVAEEKIVESQNPDESAEKPNKENSDVESHEKCKEATEKLANDVAPTKGIELPPSENAMEVENIPETNIEKDGNEQTLMEIDQAEHLENEDGSQTNDEPSVTTDKCLENEVKSGSKTDDDVISEKSDEPAKKVTTVEEENDKSQEDVCKEVKNLEENDKNQKEEIENAEKGANEDSNLKEQSPQKETVQENTECIDVEMESEKENTNDKNQEVENTEFVQFNQDKEDSQTENQSEAVDPFGGDNLNSNADSNEPMEVDSGKRNEEEDGLKDSEKSQNNEDKVCRSN